MSDQANQALEAPETEETPQALSRRMEFLQRAIPPETMQALEEAHSQFFGALASPNLTVPQRTVLSAVAMTQLREALDGPILDEVIMPLMNHPMGFDTDRNPRKHPEWKNSAPPTPYGRETVLDCALHAWLHGLQMVGNQWNIIADTMYPRKEGYEHLVSTVAKYAIEVDVPPIGKDLFEQGGYLKVPVRIRYVLHTDPKNDPENPEKPFPNRTFAGTYSVRLNRKNAVGVEACEGKAKRKALRDLYAAINGILLGDADDADQPAGSVHQVGSHFGETSAGPKPTADEILGDEPPGKNPEADESGESEAQGSGDDGPPWETITPLQAAELKQRGLDLKMDSADLLSFLDGPEEVGKIEELPAEDWDDYVEALDEREAKVKG